eukprot:CAMPEP_0197315480 /NCGR_PEP_ID=MMETSP0891-20130614/38423_1 /TAXON_ID=44058 ORGANISM="Aureoumbra lagunensis, Strain CCMP1510" /NCGR_SAMPLE_ID=MMETSP0891 /ASSEMBLY_ACC=CAM_ASM_000534 /LENGTH=280 /DNA_ID=CAMNT_0042804447 /DNA_START=163 /DNA_END=1005 /DNA_ORIENTATION=-
MSLETPNKMSPPAAMNNGPLTKEQVERYQRDGCVVVHNLLSGELLKRVCAMKEEIASSLATNEFANVAFGAYTQHEALKEVALSSTVTAAAKQLIGKNEIHVLLDAFFKLEGKNVGCGFHVDDAVFWPVNREYDQGINIWIALDPCDAEKGGGLAVAPDTHKEEYNDVRDTIQEFVDGKPQTCNLANLNPEQNARVEAKKIIPSLKPGDAILHKRFVFHRSVPFTEGQGSVARYSVRYVPNDVVLQGFSLSPDPQKPGMIALPEVRIDSVNIPNKFPPCY